MTDKPEHKGAGHRKRLRDKFLEHGLGKFTDDEIVELLLTLATPRRDCKDTARAALKEFGRLSDLLGAEPEELAKIKGIGSANILGLRLVHEIARKFLREKIMQEDFLNNFDDVLDYFRHALRDEKNESFHLLLLGAQNRVLHEEKMETGGPAHVSIDPRKIVEKAIRHSAVSIVIAHNHPGGDPSPSRADIQLTKKLLFAVGMLGLNLRDHLIIAGDGYFSFWKEALLHKFEKEYVAFEKKLAR